MSRFDHLDRLDGDELDAPAEDPASDCEYRRSIPFVVAEEDVLDDP